MSYNNSLLCNLIVNAEISELFSQSNSKSKRNNGRRRGTTIALNILSLKLLNTSSYGIVINTSTTNIDSTC